MELKGFMFYVTINGSQFCLRRDDTTKKWKIDDKQVNLSNSNLEKQIEMIKKIVEMVAILDSCVTETDILTNIASNFEGAA